MRNLHRERTLTAIRHDIPDRIPVDAICVENLPEIARFLSTDADSVLERLDLDGRIVAAPCAAPAVYGPDGEPLTEWLSSAVLDYGTTHRFPLANASSVREVERYPWPSPRWYDYDTAATVARHLAQSYAVRGPYWKPLFCQAASLMGLETALECMITRPAIFEAVLEAITEHTLEYCRMLLEACGDDLCILCLADDFATQRGLMMRPDHWRRYLKPRYARLFSLGKSTGRPVWFHACGDVTPVLPDLIEIGMDVWETVQLHTLSIPATQLKREYGKDITFFGGVATQRLPFASEDEVREETLRCIELLGKGGGYICGPDHHIKPDVPPRNVLALFDTAREFRREGYTCGSITTEQHVRTV